MAVTAMAGVVGFTPQNAKSTDPSYTPPSAWYRHKATLVDLAVNDETRLGAPEIGGVPVPTFPYKAGVIVGGGLTIQPRLQSTIGWLLHGALGYSTSTQQGVTGVYDHAYTFASSDQSYVPWMQFRKAIPRKDNAADTDIGEIYKDCKIVGLTLNLANDAPITARVDVLGRDFTIDEDPTAWTWDNTYEGFASIPIGCQTGGWVKLPSLSADPLPIMAATVGIQNVPLDIRQEKVYGSAFIEDITVIMRQVTFDLLIKWNNPDIYQAILTGSASGTAWSATPFTSSLEVIARSPGNIPTETVPYSLKIECPKAMLAMTEGIQLAGNQAIMIRLTGTALEPDAGEYTTFTLTNTTTGYTPPVGDTTPPTVSTATIEDADDDRILVNFDENVQLESGSWMAGFSCTVAAVARAIINGGRIDNNTIYLDLASPVTTGQAVLLSYTSTTGNVEDIAGNDLATFSDTVVTNNVV